MDPKKKNAITTIFIVTYFNGTIKTHTSDEINVSCLGNNSNVHATKCGSNFDTSITFFFSFFWLEKMISAPNRCGTLVSAWCGPGLLRLPLHKVVREIIIRLDMSRDHQSNTFPQTSTVAIYAILAKHYVLRNPQIRTDLISPFSIRSCFVINSLSLSLSLSLKR